jgi:hypothetical protein
MPVLSEWLEAFNERMGREGVPHLGRPLRAWSEWCRESGESLEIGDPKAQQIFEWFEGRSPAGSLFPASVFTGAFYFDAYFWPVCIPMVYGTHSLSASDSLASMPAITKTKLFANPEDLGSFKALWADCLDYGQGLLSLNREAAPASVLDAGQKEPPGSFWRGLVISGDRMLRSAVEDLCKDSPGENALQSSRMAFEMFLKAFLARDHGLSEDDARNISHDLSKLMGKVLEVTPNQVFREANTRLDGFPNVTDRYAGKPYSNSELWNAYKVAQAVAAEVIRVLANTRGTITTRF